MKKIITCLISLFLLGTAIPISAEETEIHGVSLYEEGSQTFTETDAYGEEWTMTVTALQPLEEDRNMNSRISAGTYSITGSSTYASMSFKVTVNGNQSIIRAFDNAVTPRSGFSVTANYLMQSTTSVNHHGRVSNAFTSYTYTLTCYIENGQLYHYIH